MLWRYDLLDFETGVFGAPVGRVVPMTAGLSLDVLTGEWRHDRVWMVSARIPADGGPEGVALTRAGFTPIENLVTLERPLDGHSDVPDGVRQAGPEDREPCLEIARTAFRFDRFHADQRVPEARANRLKEMWVANSLDGRADTVLVCEHDGRAAGFVTCMVGEEAAVIDLIAVSPTVQGLGIGGKLVAGACAHYAGQKPVMRVGTQRDNSRSLALYEHQGFVRVAEQRTYHWINEGAAP